LIGNINNMAGFLIETGRYDEAEPLLKEALDMSRKFYNYDHPHLARCTNNYAYLLDLKGKFTEAEPLYKEALDMRRRLYGGYYAELNVSIINMATFYDNQKKFALSRTPSPRSYQAEHEYPQQLFSFIIREREKAILEYYELSI